MTTNVEEYVEWLSHYAHGNIMEIGVREGCSTGAILGTLARNGVGHLWSVDKDDYGHLYSSPYWTFIQGNSVMEPDRILDATGMRSNDVWIDLLFVDADHSYASCLSDLTNFGRYAKVIAVHDTNSEWLGVWQAVIEYFRAPWAGRFERAQFLNASHGLGVLYR